MITLITLTDIQVPSINYNGDTVLALPKLNLQFLTFHDYLLRCFNLFRLESNNNPNNPYIITHYMITLSTLYNPDNSECCPRYI